jgi:hypothetical protein
MSSLVTRREAQTVSRSEFIGVLGISSSAQSTFPIVASLVSEVIDVESSEGIMDRGTMK